MTDDKNRSLGNYIGPHPSFELYLMTTSSYIWIGVGCLIWPFLIHWLASYNFLSFLTYVTLAIPAHILGVLLIIAGLILAHMEYVATSFVIRGSNLFISYGLITKTSNTIPLKYIFDCDTEEGPTEKAMKVKTLLIRVLDSGRRSFTLRLRFVSNADEVRDFILENSAAAQARVVTSF